MPIKYFTYKVIVDGKPSLKRDGDGSVSATVEKTSFSRTVDSNILYDDETGLLIVPATLWLIDLIADPSFDFDNNLTATKGLRAYFQFMKDNGFTWNCFPRTKIQRPTYAFKRFMMSKVKCGDYSYNTGNQFLGVVKRFYLWANRERIISFDQINPPFIIDDRRMTIDTKVGKKQFSVTTCDLKLPKKLKGTPRIGKSASTRNLTPLNSKNRTILAHGLQLINKPHVTLCCQLSMLSGLRQEECLTIPYGEFIGNAADIRLQEGGNVTLRIGGNDGTKTKYGVVRDVEIPFLLYERLCDYAISNKRLALENKTQEEATRLFLNNVGQPFKSDEMTKRMSDIRHLIVEQTGEQLDHKYHDLRCTYATEYGSRMLDRGLSYVDVFNEVKSRLGHVNDRDTERYMRIIETRKTRKQGAIELEQFTQEVLQSDG